MPICYLQLVVFPLLPQAIHKLLRFDHTLLELLYPFHLLLVNSPLLLAHQFTLAQTVLI